MRNAILDGSLWNTWNTGIDVYTRKSLVRNVIFSLYFFKKINTAMICYNFEA